MTKPKWILDNEKFLGQLRLDRFPIPCCVRSETFRSSILGWTQTIIITLTIKERNTGTDAHFPVHITLNKNTNLKNELRQKLIEFTIHEIEETIQFEQLDGTREIPFDPHK